MSTKTSDDSRKTFAFDRAFQEKIVQALLTDKHWAAQMAEVLDVGHFEYTYLRQLTEKYLGYYRQYKEFPSIELMISYVREGKETKTLDEVLVNQMVTVLKNTSNKKDLGDLPHVKEQSMSFCRQQGFKKAIMECADLASSEEHYDQAVEIVKRAISAGLAQSPGLTLDDIDARYSETYRNTIKTNICSRDKDWSLVDGASIDSKKLLNGGAGAGELCVVIAPTGCHAKGTLILMFDGTAKKVEEVRLGDQLMGPDSKARTVLRLIRGKDQMCRIVPVKGDSFVVNEQHILSLRHTETKKIVNVSVSEYLKKSKTFKHLHKLYRSEPIEFQQQQTLPVDPYMLGVMLGDGWLSSKRVEITTADAEIARSMWEFAENNSLGVSIHNKRANKSIGLYLTNKGKRHNPVIKKLATLGLIDSNSANKFIPGIYKTSSIKDRLALLAGLMDTDGSQSHSCFDYISKSKQLALDVAFVARSLGLAAYVKSTKKSCQTKMVGTYFRVSISGNTDKIPCKLQRKQPRPRQQVKNVLNTGFTVQTLPKDDFYGFTVDNDSLYLMQDFTVSHNCGKSHFMVHVGAQALLQNKNVIHFTFELHERAVGVRYDSHLLGIDSLDCIEHKQEIKDFYAANAGNIGKLRIKYLPTGNATVNTLRQFIDKVSLEGFRPDLVIVDYAGIMRSTEKYELPRLELKKIYEELRAFASELDVPVWTACQSNKDGAQEDIITLANMAEAYAQAHICDFVVGLGRPESQKSTGIGTIFIAKNRNGIDGVSFKCRINTAQSRISMLSEEDVKNFTADQMHAEEEGRSFVSRAWKEIKSKKAIGDSEVEFHSSRVQ